MRINLIPTKVGIRFWESNSLTRTVFVGSGIGGKTFQTTVRGLISKGNEFVLSL